MLSIGYTFFLVRTNFVRALSLKILKIEAQFQKITIFEQHEVYKMRVQVLKCILKVYLFGVGWGKEVGQNFGQK